MGMKKLFSNHRLKPVLAGLAMLVMLWEGRAAEITLAWDAPAHNTDGTVVTDLAGYRVHYGTASGSYSSVLDVGSATTATVSGLLEGQTYFFAVRAYNSYDLESDFSNELQWDAPVPAPEPPAIVAQPADVSVAEPAGTQFSVEATGDGPLSYQWRRNGVALPDGTGSVLTLAATSAAADDGAVFDVVVMSDAGAVVSRSAVLSVADTTAPALDAPASSTLTADAQDQAAIPDFLGVVTVSDNVSATAAIALAQVPAAGATVGLGETVVTISATDEAGNRSERTVLVTVNPRPRPNPPQNVRVVSITP
jgi:hypothetical protein